jgi:cytochrome P450
MGAALPQEAFLVETAIGDEAYDPFEAFDHAQGIGRIDNPYPRLAELRRQAPVHRADFWKLFELPGPTGEAFLSEAPFYSALSYNAVTQVLRDSELFSSSIYANAMGPVMGHSLLEMDEPEHAGYRALIEQAFSRRAMERWEAEVITPTINSFIDKFVERGSADLVREFTFPFPIHVITGMLGLPPEDLPQFHAQAVSLINVGADFPRAIEASKKLGAYLTGIIAQRRAEPRDDLISLLAHSEVDGHRLTDDEICAFLRLLLPAGAETTYRSSSNLLFGLLTHTDQLDALRDDRSLMTAAIDEGLRWEPPLLSIVRTATRDTTVDGVDVEGGSVINVWIASANHDETRWEEPEEFNILRKRIPHVAFGFGPHVCLGQHLARMETTMALNALFDRLPGLRLDPEAGEPAISGLMFRSPPKLPVRFG